MNCASTRARPTPINTRSSFVKVAAREPALEEPVARYLYKLMAYKDEYEVARLLTKAAFEEQIGDMWEQVESIGYNLHPPILRALGWKKKKMHLGQWFGHPLRMLAKLKSLRGTPLDPFGYARVRAETRTGIDCLVPQLTIEELLDETDARKSLAGNRNRLAARSDPAATKRSRATVSPK